MRDHRSRDIVADAAVPPASRRLASSSRFTAKQGQYLAFIYYCSKVHRRSPAEAELGRFFEVSPPTVHQMLRALEARGLVAREPGKARSLRVLVGPDTLPELE